MAYGSEDKAGNRTLGFLLGAAVVGLGVLGFLYYQHTHREVLRIDVPGFSGSITKDGSKGVDIEVGPK